jgi:hypothetical protein
MDWTEFRRWAEQIVDNWDEKNLCLRRAGWKSAGSTARSAPPCLSFGGDYGLGSIPLSLPDSAWPPSMMHLVKSGYAFTLVGWHS